MDESRWGYCPEINVWFWGENSTVAISLFPFVFFGRFAHRTSPSSQCALHIVKGKTRWIKIRWRRDGICMRDTRRRPVSIGSTDMATASSKNNDAKFQSIHLRVFRFQSCQKPGLDLIALYRNQSDFVGWNQSKPLINEIFIAHFSVTLGKSIDVNRFCTLVSGRSSLISF